MVSSKNVTGILAVFVVAFMVATAFVPAVNAFASGNEDADSLTYVKGADSDSGTPIAVDGENDLMSILSSLMGGADLSELAELFQGQDIKDIIEKIRSADAQTVLATALANILAPKGDESEIDDLIEKILFYLHLIEHYLDDLTPESRTIYIPDFKYGVYEFVGITLAIVFNDGEFIAATASADEIRAVVDTNTYEVGDVSVTVFADGFSSHFGYIVYGGERLDFDVDFETKVTADGTSTELSLLDDTIYVRYTSVEEAYGETEEYYFYMEHFIVFNDEGAQVDLDEIEFTYHHSQIRVAVGATVEKATCNGKDVTKQVNEAMDDFLDYRGEEKVQNFEYELLTIGPVKFENITLQFTKDGDEFGVSLGHQDTNKFSIGEYITGEDLDMFITINMDKFTYDGTVEQVSIASPDGTQTFVELKDIKSEYAEDDDSLKVGYSVGEVNILLDDMRINCGGDTAFSYVYEQNYRADSAITAIYHDSAEVVPAVGKGYLIPGYMISGNFDGSPSGYADQNKAEVVIYVFDTDPIAYAEIEYGDIYGYANIKADYAVFREPFTYVAESSVSWGGEISVDTKVGIGLGRSVALGGDEFFCIYPSLDYDGSADAGFTVSYEFKDSTYEVKKPTCKMEMTVGDDGCDIHICMKDLDYQTAPANETYLSADEADLYIHFADGQVTTVLTVDNMGLGQFDSSQKHYCLNAETVFISKTSNGFTGDRVWTVIMDDVTYTKGDSTETVSDMFTYTLAVDKDGKITNTSAKGDLNLNIDPKDSLEIREDYYLSGTASIANDRLIADLEINLFGDSAPVGNIEIGDIVMFGQNFSNPGQPVDFGPFRNLIFMYQYGGAVTIEEMKQDAIVFRETVNDDVDYISKIKIDGNKLTFDELFLSKHGDTSKVRANNFLLEMNGGYTISLDTANVGISYDKKQTVCGGVEINLGVSESPKAVNIHTYKAESGVEFTDMSFVLGKATLMLQADGVTATLYVNLYGDHTTISIQETADNVETMEKVENLDLALTVINGDDEFQSIGMQGFNYQVHVDEKGAEVLDSLQIDNIFAHDYDVTVTLTNIMNVAEEPGKFTVGSFESTGFNGGKLVSFQEKATDPAIIIDATAEDRTVVQVYGLKLDNTASQGNNKLDIVGVEIVITDDEEDISVGAVTAVFNDFYFKPTESKINGSISYDSTKPFESVAHLTINQITDIQEGKATFNGVKYDLSFKDQKPFENKFSFDSFWNAASSKDASLKIGASSFDFITGSYSVHDIIFDDYGRSMYSGHVDYISYTENDSALSVIPIFDFKLGETYVLDKHAHLFKSNGLEVKVDSVATQTDATITLSIDGDLEIYRGAYGYKMTVDQFRAVAKSALDARNFDVKATQKVAMVEVVDLSDMSYVRVDFSKDVFNGKMDISKGTVFITGTYDHDDKITVLTDPKAYPYTLECVGTSVFSVTYPSDSESSGDFTLDYKYQLEKMVVGINGVVGEADIDLVAFSLAASSTDGETVIDFDAYAGFSYNVAGHRLAVESAYFGLYEERDGEGERSREIDVEVDHISYSVYGSGIEIESIQLEEDQLVADYVVLMDDECEIEFEDVHVFGGVFYADSMKGTVDGFDVLNLRYDDTKDPGERLLACRGIFYFNPLYGIIAFMNNEPVYPPEEDCMVFYVPSVEMTFIGDDGEEDSYAVPVNSRVELGAYYDITPVPVIELGIAVTTDVYTVEDCNVEVRPAKTILETIDDFGTIVLTTGSGIVFNSEMLAEVEVPTVTIVTPQGIMMQISLDALKILATDCGTTMLGITADDPMMYIDELSSILGSLSDGNAQRVMNGMVVSVNTGKSVHTAGLGDVRISVPLDSDSSDFPKISSYHIDVAHLDFNGTCSVEWIDDMPYAVFTVSHFSDFLICEALDESPTDFTVAAIVLLLVGIALACIVVQLRRQNTF